MVRRGKLFSIAVLTMLILAANAMAYSGTSTDGTNIDVNFFVDAPLVESATNNDTNVMLTWLPTGNWYNPTTKMDVNVGIYFGKTLVIDQSAPATGGGGGSGVSTGNIINLDENHVLSIAGQKTGILLDANQITQNVKQFGELVRQKTGLNIDPVNLGVAVILFALIVGFVVLKSGK